jgi:acyl-CoA thioesterase-2
VSDLTLLSTTLIRHHLTPHKEVQIASLDHAIWFHRPARADDWLLYDQNSPSASGARGLATGRIFTRDGTLVATVVQEGLLRVNAT